MKWEEAIRIARGSMSLPARGAWIEITYNTRQMSRFMSLPARGAWIEIKKEEVKAGLLLVAPRKGSVD